MKFTVLALTAAALSLAACGQKTETSVPADTAASSAASSAAGNDALQTLTSTDGKIRILIQGSQFEDASKDESAVPSNVDTQELTMLQRDNHRDITLYVVNLGAAKSDAKTYFNNLKTTLNNAKELENVETGMATDNRMNYRFTQTDAGGNTLLENCIAIHETDIYNVCANSSTASQEDLATVLKDANLAK